MGEAEVAVHIDPWLTMTYTENNNKKKESHVKIWKIHNTGFAVVCQI